MQISSTTKKELAKIITGDFAQECRRSGPQLVSFFNDFSDEKDVYGRGFPTRFKYAEEKIDHLNGTPKLCLLIEETFHLVHFGHKLSLLNETVCSINQHLCKDGYVIEIQQTEKGICGKIKSNSTKTASFKNSPLDHEFINEQINKCHSKLSSNPPDIDGAITNARSLVESMLEFSLKKLNQNMPQHDGDLLILYKELRKHLNLDPNKDLDDTLKQTLSGLISIVNGIAGLSNKISDRHTRQYKPLHYHGKLVVNASFTLCEFLSSAVERKQGS